MTLANLIICAAVLSAAAACAESPKGVTPGSIATFTAASANVSGAPDAIRIDILRWSTDAERGALMDAWTGKAPAPSGRGAAEGRAGRGRAGRGAAANTPPPPPEATLAKALKGATTVGYVWSREIAGYAIRFAERIQNPDGSARILLVTDRRLGAVNDQWNPAAGEPSSYDFSVIELRIKPNGEGDGKASLTGKVTPDAAFKMVALQNYDSLPIVFTHVQRHTSGQHQETK